MSPSGQSSVARVIQGTYPKVLGILGVIIIASTGSASGAIDPGVRGGGPGASGPLPNLTAQELVYFQVGAEAFAEVDSVTGALPGEPGEGLGPRFNLNGCAGCHAQPAMGGTSPAVNPQVAVATLDGAHNAVPWFVVANGPVREARFKKNPDGTPDGGVHDLFVISGRSDAASCSIAQPDFGRPGSPLTGQGGNPNVIFRIPTPLFGAGLIEAIQDSTILDNARAAADAKRRLGISGHPNLSGNDGTVTRFGWKAQNKSLRMFAGEAYNVEQGVTNQLFAQERDESPACLLNATPEDHLDLTATTPDAVLSDLEHFTNFMNLLAPPVPAPSSPSISNGSQIFGSIGCALCHTPALRTGTNMIAALSGQTVNLFSDLILHDMGMDLADGISQGAAGPREFRTAPLWGLGQRIFFLHDGRTADLVDAIRAHGSIGSEANAVIFRAAILSDRDKQDLLNFLRSL